MKRKVWSEVKSYTVITFSLFLYAIGIAAFLIPAEVVNGGVSGIGTLIFFASEGQIPVAYPYFIINAFLILFAIKVLGPSFGVKSVFAIFVTALFLYLIQLFVTEPLVEEKFMGTIIGAIFAGTGVGLAISQGGSTGGSDIIAMLINKYRNISPGRIILYFDILVVGASYFIFDNITPIIYGFAAMGVTAYFIDFVITGRKQSVQFFIFTEKHDDVAERISAEIGRGVSLIDTYGWYSQKEKKAVFVLTKKTEARHIFRIVKQTDPHAFISMNVVNGVYGKGFEEIRA